MPSQNKAAQRMDQAWPFDDWLGWAVRRYNLSPREFWSMSVRDWRALSREHMGQLLSHTQLQELSELYPDETECVKQSEDDDDERK